MVCLISPREKKTHPRARAAPGAHPLTRSSALKRPQSDFGEWVEGGGIAAHLKGESPPQRDLVCGFGKNCPRPDSESGVVNVEIIDSQPEQRGYND